MRHPPPEPLGWGGASSSDKLPGPEPQGPWDGDTAVHALGHVGRSGDQSLGGPSLFLGLKFLLVLMPVTPGPPQGTC